eukprot:XP_001708080.1 Hypothetical protein GL50803_23810 [Giardia lamblia ATCC 50803]
MGEVTFADKYKRENSAAASNTKVHPKLCGKNAIGDKAEPNA